MIYDKLFWILFILIGVSLVLIMINGIVYLDIILGLFAIAIGIEMLAFEFSSRGLRQKDAMITGTLNKIIEWLNGFAKINEKNTGQQDSKKLFEEFEEREKRIVKKVLELENRLNEVSKAFSGEIVRSGRGSVVGQRDPRKYDL